METIRMLGRASSAEDAAGAGSPARTLSESPSHAEAAASRTTAVARRSRSIDPGAVEAGRTIVGARRFGAADRFLLLIDRELRARGLGGFQAVLAVELDGAL